MKETQLLKGVLEGCVLSIINKQKVYAYELVQLLRGYGFESITAGTVYPLVQKLEKQQMIRSESLPSQEGPDRNYFFITNEGKNRLEEFLHQWDEMNTKVDNLLKENG